MRPLPALKTFKFFSTAAVATRRTRMRKWEKVAKRETGSENVGE